MATTRCMAGPRTMTWMAAPEMTSCRAKPAATFCTAAAATTICRATQATTCSRAAKATTICAAAKVATSCMVKRATTGWKAAPGRPEPGGEHHRHGGQVHHQQLVRGQCEPGGAVQHLGGQCAAEQPIRCAGVRHGGVRPAADGPDHALAGIPDGAAAGDCCKLGVSALPSPARGCGPGIFFPPSPRDTWPGLT